MVYFSTITKHGTRFYGESFGNDAPLTNRRNAIARAREFIQVVKSKTVMQSFQNLPWVLLQPERYLQGLIELAATPIEELCFSVYTEDDILPGQQLVIESSHFGEEALTECRSFEYQAYLKNGYDTGGEPVEVYYPRAQCHAPVLRDSEANEIGLRQLLIS